MNEWRELKIGEILQLEYGKALRDYHVGNGDYDVFGTNGKIGKTSTFIYDKPSLIIGRKGAYRGVHFTNTPFFVIDTAFYSKQRRDDVNTKFLYYWFKMIDINSMDSGSAIPSTSRDEVYDIDILLPSYDEQNQIEQVLSSLDDKIDLLHRQNKTLEAMAETLFRQWFVEEAKEDWEWCELGEYIDVHRGLSYKGSGLRDDESGIPMHNLNSVYEGGGYKYEGIKYYSGDYKERHLVRPGDIIIANTEQGHDLLLIGYPAIVPQYYGNIGIFSQHIYKLEIKSIIISGLFLYFLLMTPDVRDQITGATNGSTVNMLPKNGIEWAKFRLPPLEKIKAYSEIVEPFFEKKEANFIQIRHLQKLRDTLLPKLMSGEVRVNMDKSLIVN